MMVMLRFSQPNSSWKRQFSTEISSRSCATHFSETKSYRNSDNRGEIMSAISRQTIQMQNLFINESIYICKEKYR